MTTCCNVFGLIFLVLTNLVVIISFATPYWVNIRDNDSSNGLWAYCKSDQCTWVFEDDYKDMKLLQTDSVWWIATLGLTSSGLGLCLFALLLATIALCCDCRGCNASHAIGGLLFTAFLALGVASVVFGVCANEHDAVQMKEERTHGRWFGWSFWLNVGAAGLALLTSLVYMIDGRAKQF